jgi:Uma2 family endonuclease
MSSLTLKGIPESLHERLRHVAESNRRSLNAEVIHRLERSVETGDGAPMVVRESAAAAYLMGGMSAGTDPRPLTLEDFIALPEEELFRVELADGRLVREPAPGFRHGRVASRLLRILWQAVGESEHGEVFADMGFQLSADPPTVRVPDVALVSATRLAESQADDVFLATAPDLAVEILSPSNSASEIQRKAFEYLDAGAHLVWIADADVRTVMVYRARDDIRMLGEGDSLDGTAVMPGLEVKVRDLFE